MKNIIRTLYPKKTGHKNTELTQHGPIEVCLDCGGWFDETAQRGVTMKRTKTKIILCKDCHGTGLVNVERRVGAYDTDTSYNECSSCFGSGRLVKTISYEALKECP